MTREEAIKRLKEARFTVQPYLYMNEAFDVAIEALSQPERPKGRWMNGNCTNCGGWCGSVDITILPNICPNCGADMRGEEE